ncbi:MAG TPA: HAD-IA family hydrolase [Tepidisphaeraceae bacterium]|jgi:HAD superfamily hydrolase (TIGR01509 family)|nr:HAD-IA family hydrolase [Tepidisphaeraceae bacterium]
MMNYPPLRGIIFDLDGVLSDSEPFIKRAAMQMFREGYHLEVKPEDFVPFFGAGEDRFIGGVAEKYGVKLTMPRDKTRVYDIYLEIIQGQMKALPGAAAYVRRSRERGLKLAVATSADRRKMVGNLRQIGIEQSAFDVIVTGDEVEKKKPDPEIFLLAAEKLGLAPAECLVVEDAISGVKAGQAAGSRVLAVATTFPAEELRKYHPDYLAKNLAEAPEIT